MSLSDSILHEQIVKERLETCLIWQNGQLHYEYEQNKAMLSNIRQINSCTKSVVSLLCCIGMEKGLFPQPEQSALHYFPQLKDVLPSHFREPTIEHILTLSVGFRWQEFGGIQSFPTMKRTLNWLEYVFSQPIIDEPGEKMCYNSGISQMLTALLTQTSGLSVAEFAEQHLFQPLDIKSYKWLKDKQGIYTGGYGLSLTPYDMLKLGVLCIQEGQYKNKQIVSPARLKQATTPYFPAQEPADSGYYGWHWWIDEIKHEEQVVSFYYARGYGGQFIFIVPALTLVVVTTKDQKVKGELPLEWFKHSLLPSYVLSSTS